jgi:hypothetical protein
MPAQYLHPSLGNLQCLSKGEWLGQLQWGREDIELRVAGSEIAPQPALLNVAASVLLRLQSVRIDSLAAAKQHATELGWLDLASSAEWEVIALEFLDPNHPTCFNVICYEGIKDIYGWWQVAWNDQALCNVLRKDW